MPFTVRLDPDLGLVHFTATDTFSTEDMMTCVEKVIAAPGFQPRFNHLVDMRRVEAYEASGADVRIRAKRNHDDVRLNASKVALVAANDLVFGMSRMYEILMHGAGVTVRTFRDMDEALAWLEIPANKVKF